MIVLHGSASGLTGTGSAFIDQPGLASDGVEAFDNCGSAVATADFNSDGRADLANAGAINVLYGSAAGLTAAGDQFFSEATSGIVDVPNSFDRLGFALAGSGGAAGPGLTGTWRGVTQSLP